jgi:hypothetical protein
MTETCTVVSWTSEHDILRGSSGSLLPGAKAKIVDAEGHEVTKHDQPGELYVQAPSVVIGYLNNEKATDETFVFHEDGRWIRTGDEAIMTKSKEGNEHLVIVDRIKELIKVKVCGIPKTLFPKHTHRVLTRGVHVRYIERRSCCASTWGIAEANTMKYRVIKLPRLNWKPIFSPIQPSTIAP